MSEEPKDFSDLSKYDLPPGAYRAPTTPKPIRWPDDLYGDLNKICQHIKNATGKTISVSRIVIVKMTEYRDQHKHLIEKKKK